MRKLLFALAVMVPMLALYDLAHAEGYDDYDDDEGAINIENTNRLRATSRSTSRANARSSSRATGGDATNEGNNAELGMVLNQDIDLTENSLVTVSPALSANGVDCNMQSRSFSILIFSYGRSKCEKGSVMWRDYARIDQIAGPIAAMGVLCRYKPFKKVSHLAVMADGTIGVDCRKLRKQLRLHGVHVLPR